MPTYDPCGDDVEALARKVLAADYKDLIEAEVTFGFLFATAAVGKNGVARGPALKLHGYPAAAIIKVNSLQDRVEGMTDVTVRLDLRHWEDLDVLGREGLLGHEFYHLVLLREKDGTLKADSAGRPRLKCRPHDFQIGGFQAIATRHGDHAPETRSLRQLAADFKEMVQGIFNFG